MATGEHEQIETERKYDVDTGFVLPDLTGAGGSASMAPPDVQRLEATYFDTDDLRLIGAHITLRRRTGGDDAGWHIKLPVGGDTRREVHFPLGPPGRVVPGRDRRRGRPAGRAGRPCARSPGWRPAGPCGACSSESGEVLAEVADDQVTGSRPDPADPETWRLQDTWREVEVELKSGTRTCWTRRRPGWPRRAPRRPGRPRNWPGSCTATRHDRARPQTPALPQLHGIKFVTDGGMETDLIFHHGVDLPDFAAFPLLTPPRDAACYPVLRRLRHHRAAAGAGLMLEAPTWRANPDWGTRLGYSAADLTRVNTAAITLLAGLRERYTTTLGIGTVLVGGMIGPRSDGYTADGASIRTRRPATTVRNSRPSPPSPTWPRPHPH